MKECSEYDPLIRFVYCCNGQQIGGYYESERT